MQRRQSVPCAWLVVDERMGEAVWGSVRRLPPGSGILVVYRDMPAAERAKLVAKLRRVAAGRRLVIVDEHALQAARVHDLRELRRAGLRRVPLLFLSPIFHTRSHPDRPPLRRMEAAALLRLAKVPVIALGGMDARRFLRARQLGFDGWAGIDAWKLRT